MKRTLTVGAAGLGLLLASGARADPPAAPSAEQAAPATPRAPSGPLANPDPDGPPVHHTVWPYLLAGAGLALFTTGILFEVSSVHQSDQADRADQALAQLADGDPRKPQIQADRDDHHGSATAERTAAIVLATAGVLTVAGSVVLWFVEAGQPAPSPGAKTQRRVVPTFGRGFAGAAFGGTF